MPSKSKRRKASFEGDFEKVSATQVLLGTRTLTAAVDWALDEVMRQRDRRRLVELLFDGQSVALDDPEVMAAAWR